MKNMNITQHFLSLNFSLALFFPKVKIVSLLYMIEKVGRFPYISYIASIVGANQYEFK